MVHPQHLTKPLKNDGWKTSFLLGRPIFRGYVEFPGCKYDWIRSNFHGFVSRFPNQKWGKSLLEPPHLTWPMDHDPVAMSQSFWPTTSPFAHQNYLAWNHLKHDLSCDSEEGIVKREFADNSGWCNSEKQIWKFCTQWIFFKRANHFEAPQRQSDSKNLGDFKQFWRRVFLLSWLKSWKLSEPNLPSWNQTSQFSWVSTNMTMATSPCLQQGIHLLHLGGAEFYQIFPP